MSHVLRQIFKVDNFITTFQQMSLVAPATDVLGSVSKASATNVLCADREATGKEVYRLYKW